MVRMYWCHTNGLIMIQDQSSLTAAFWIKVMLSPFSNTLPIILIKISLQYLHKHHYTTYQLVSLCSFWRKPLQHHLGLCSCTRQNQQCVPPCAYWCSHKARCLPLIAFEDIWKSNSAKESNTCRVSGFEKRLKRCFSSTYNRLNHHFLNFRCSGCHFLLGLFSWLH